MLSEWLPDARLVNPGKYGNSGNADKRCQMARPTIVADEQPALREDRA
jgi:hypothetical protein